MFYNSVINMGRKYFHWVDLRLIKPMEMVMYKFYLAKNGFLSTWTLLTSNKTSTNVKKGPEPPTPTLFATKQTGRSRSEAKNAGVKTLSSFIWTFMVTKENG